MAEASKEKRASSVLDNFGSRRSDVRSLKGICSSSQHLASAIGAKILQAGGNAADAAVAMAAALNVLEPCSTGIGGDAFALYFNASDQKVFSLQGNGASPAALSIDLLSSKGIGILSGQRPLDKYSGLCVTVPGAALLWEDMVARFGVKSMGEVLQPAISLAEEGFPIGPVTAEQWPKGFLQGEEAHRVLRPNGRNPKPGDVLRNPDLAKTFKHIAEHGAKEGFYRNEIAEKMVEAAREYGGVLTLEDLDAHFTATEEAISVLYKGYRVYETPPPTHGLAALIALSILDKMDTLHPREREEGMNGSSRGSELEAHYGIESTRLAFADALHYLSDPLHYPTPIETLLSEKYTTKRAQLIQSTASFVSKGDASEFLMGDTVYFCCIDAQGNGCSMINSNYMNFGTGIMPKGTGFTLQNRGYNFSLLPDHPNALAPRKRPYHTIIPALITCEADKSLFSVLGNMGGFMQPQGHVQLVRNLIDFKLSPQAAVDVRTVTRNSLSSILFFV